MLALISFIVVMVGAINWFCIGLLQYDFVAGLFGSQSSIFSRIVYIAVGLGALVLLYNLIENKGKIKFNFKKKSTNKAEYERQGVDMYYTSPRPVAEAGNDLAIDDNKQNHNIETGKDNIDLDETKQSDNTEAGTDNIGRDVTEESRRKEVESANDLADDKSNTNE